MGGECSTHETMRSAYKLLVGIPDTGIEGNKYSDQSKIKYECFGIGILLIR